MTNFIQRHLGNFGEADKVRSDALKRLASNDASRHDELQLATIDFVAASVIFHVNVLVHIETIYIRDRG